uniref:hypothetical protein n=1 Tax=Candidatus Fimivicinus sp. TaxID=3056640 RepID=UPI003FF0290E
MNRKFRRAARILYRENFGFIFLCSLLVFGLLPLTDLLVQTIPFLSNPSMRILARLIASVLSAPLFCGDIAALLHLRKTGEHKWSMLFHFSPAPGSGGRRYVLAFRTSSCHHFF